jgi:hypothetical protein
MLWFGAHPEWVGFGLGVLVGVCLAFFLVGLLIADPERDHFEEMDL